MVIARASQGDVVECNGLFDLRFAMLTKFV